MTILILIIKMFLIVLLAVFVLTVLLSIIPFDYYISFKNDQGIVLRIRILWAGFLGISGTYDINEAFRAKLIIFNREMALELKENIKKKNIIKNKDEKITLRKKDKRKIIKEILDKGFFEEIFSYVRNMMKIIKPKTFKLKLSYGFDDPSITGCLSGLIYCLKEIIPTGNFDILPIFDEEILNINMDIDGRIRVGTILLMSLKFFLNKNVRKKFKNLKKAETFG